MHSWTSESIEQLLFAWQADEDLGAGDGEEGDWGEDAAEEPQNEAATAADKAPAAAVAAAGASDDDSDDDVAAGVKGGGFRYRQVPKADYGLTIEDMLTMDPKELNQVCPWLFWIIEGPLMYRSHAQLVHVVSKSTRLRTCCHKVEGASNRQ